MGEAYTGMDVVFDTGSDWLVVEGFGCSTCEGNTFNGDLSGTQVGSAVSERLYGSASLEGIEYKDKVCLYFSQCINDFEYFLISKQTGIREPIDGILGLSRAKDVFAEDPSRKLGPLYVQYLRNAGLISSNTFSFYMQPYGA